MNLEYFSIFLNLIIVKSNKKQRENELSPLLIRKKRLQSRAQLHFELN